jgi:hypothetical protein
MDGVTQPSSALAAGTWIRPEPLRSACRARRSFDERRLQGAARPITLGCDPAGRSGSAATLCGAGDLRTAHRGSRAQRPNRRILWDRLHGRSAGREKPRSTPRPRSALLGSYGGPMHEVRGPEAFRAGLRPYCRLSEPVIRCRTDIAKAGLVAYARAVRVDSAGARSRSRFRLEAQPVDWSAGPSEGRPVPEHLPALAFDRRIRGIGHGEEPGPAGVLQIRRVGDRAADDAQRRLSVSRFERLPARCDVVWAGAVSHGGVRVDTPDRGRQVTTSADESPRDGA